MYVFLYCIRKGRSIAGRVLMEVWFGSGFHSWEGAQEFLLRHRHTCLGMYIPYFLHDRGRGGFMTWHFNCQGSVYSSCLGLHRATSERARIFYLRINGYVNCALL